MKTIVCTALVLSALGLGSVPARSACQHSPSDAVGLLSVLAIEEPTDVALSAQDARDQALSILMRRLQAAEVQREVELRAMDETSIAVLVINAAITDPSEVLGLLSMPGQFGIHRILRKHQSGFVAGDGERIVQDRRAGASYVIEARPVVSSEHIADVRAEPDQNDRPAVFLQFDDEGRRLFRELTETSVGSTIAIVLDGRVVMAPRIQTPIVGGTAMLTGDMSEEEAERMAQLLGSGAVQAQMLLLAQWSVQASVNDSRADGPMALLRLQASSPLDPITICDRLEPLSPVDVTLQPAGVGRSNWFVWIAMEDEGAETAHDMRSAVETAMQETASVTLFGRLGAKVKAGDSGVLGGVLRWFD